MGQVDTAEVTQKSQHRRRIRHATVIPLVIFCHITATNGYCSRNLLFSSRFGNSLYIRHTQGCDVTIPLKRSSHFAPGEEPGAFFLARFLVYGMDHQPGHPNPQPSWKIQGSGNLATNLAMKNRQELCRKGQRAGDSPGSLSFKNDLWFSTRGFLTTRALFPSPKAYFDRSGWRILFPEVDGD